jgi:hypothetical protein
VSGAGSFFNVGIIRWNGIMANILFSPPPSPYGLGGGNFDWMWRWVVLLPQNVASGMVFTNQGVDILIESKAKRRMGNDNGLLLVVAAIGIGFDWVIDVRYFFKE